MEEGNLSPRRAYEGQVYLDDLHGGRGAASPMMGSASSSVIQERHGDNSPRGPGQQNIRTDANVTPLKLRKKGEKKSSVEETSTSNNISHQVAEPDADPKTTTTTSSDDSKNDASEGQQPN